ncbi:ABC transporter substrate-binding protein [Anaerocolumna jejuensis]|uniref:ABC transporter substrate-binding protein n=1 Tax=Anaerocolumna jejuensis TaxID=259063 RepID=UPI003F7B56C8
MKWRGIKKFLAVLIASSMVLSTGCSNSVSKDNSSGETSKTGETTAEAGKTTDSKTNLSIMWWGSDARHEATQKVLDMYTAKSGVKFTTEYTGWDGYWSKLPVLAASNSMPDILQMDAAYIHQYVDSGQLADLTNLVDLSGLVGEDEIENYKINGKLYGVPLSRNGQGIVYSKTKLAKYGIDEPANGWSWEDMIAWARSAKKKLPSGIYPLYDVRNVYPSYQEYVQSHGGAKTLDGNQFNFSQDTYKEFMKLYNDLVDEGLCPSADVSISNVELDPLNDNFLNGKVLLRSVSIGSVASLAEMLPDDELGCVSLPQGDGGSGWCQSTIFFAVGANSKNVEAAAKFIQYFISDVDAGKTLMTVRGLPLSDEVYNSFAGELTKYQLKSKEMYDKITADGVKFTPYWDDVPTAFTTWATEYKAQAEAIMLGETSIEKAATYLDEFGKDTASSAAK